MSRRSAASLEVAVAAMVPGRRPDPLSSLSREEAEIWKHIVASMPADWFTPEMWPLLKILCVNSALSDRIQKEMDDMRLGSVEHNRCLKSRDICDRLVLAVSTKLKLTAQSRHNMNKASKATKEAVDLQKHGGRPWAKLGESRVPA